MYSIKLENLKETDSVLDKYHLLKLNQDQINNLNTPISHSKIETVIKILQTKRCPGPDGFSTESYWTFKEAIKEMLPQIIPQNRNGRNISQFVI